MNFIASILFYLTPEWRLHSTPWHNLWIEREKEQYTKLARFSIAIYILVEIAHHFFVDKPLGLTTDTKWVFYRFGLAAAGGLCLWFTYVDIKSKKPIAYKAPLIALGIVTSYLQTLSMTWFNEIPYLWGIVLPALFTVILRMTPFWSLIYSAAIYALQFSHYSSAKIELPLILGACFTGLVFVAIFRRSMDAEVVNFIDQQKRLEIERKLVESKKEFLEQLQGFLPEAINQRINLHITQDKMSILQAVDEELRPKEKIISCLYSDIRSYTQLSKNQSYIKNAVLPDTREAITIVEAYSGIPRTIGDLVFAYFDQVDMKSNIINSILSAYEISEATDLRNRSFETDSEKIKRSMILTIGKAIVGNLGGSSSSREITALGPCVNKSNRLDELVKLEPVSKHINHKSLVICQSTMMMFWDLFPNLDIKQINIHNENIKIRDFETEDLIGIIDLNDRLKLAMESELNSINKDVQLRRAG